MSISWKLESNGRLVIYQSGKMPDYESRKSFYPPWKSKREEIKSVYVDDGIKNIGAEAFEFLEEVESITLPPSIKKIGNYAFLSCSNLKEINIPCQTTEFGHSCFERCSSLEYIFLPPKVKTMEGFIFKGCQNLHFVAFPAYHCVPSGTFIELDNLKTLFLPKAVKAFGPSSFFFLEPCFEPLPPRSNLNIYYEGTKDDWMNIRLEENNPPLSSFNVIYNSALCPKCGKIMQDNVLKCTRCGVAVSHK